MNLDLNDYYPCSNLPRLYRLRGGAGDEKRAVETAIVALAACRASLARKPDDPWARPTLLGAAFDAGDTAEARRLLEQIRQEGAVKWKLQTTIEDLQDSLSLQRQTPARAGLQEVLTAVREMVGP